MTPEEGYSLSEYRRPGVKVVMGITNAKEASVEPLPKYNLNKLPGDSSWHLRDLRLWLGFIPPLWALVFAYEAKSLGREVTKEDYKGLQKSTTLDQAKLWLETLRKENK